MPAGNPEPLVSQEDLAAKSAADDALLASILGGSEPEEEVEPEEVLEAEEEDAEEPEAEEAEGEEEPTATFTEDDHATAWQALRRDGWDPEAIKAMDRDSMIRAGLKRAQNQRDVDGVFSERAQLRQKLGLGSSEADEVKPGTRDSAKAESGDPGTGTDLDSLARPVAEKIADMDDPEEVASALAGFVKQALQSQMHELRTEQKLRERALRLVGSDFEGDVDSLMQEASSLGAAGRHGDKTGLARFDALFTDALKLSGVSAAQGQTSTSRTKPKTGTRPPITGTKGKPKPRTKEERDDAILAAIIKGGVRDERKLRNL